MVGNLVIREWELGKKKAPTLRAEVLSFHRYGAVHEALLQCIFDVVVRMCDDNSMYLQGTQIEASAKDGADVVRHHVQVWRVEPIETENAPGALRAA